MKKDEIRPAASRFVKMGGVWQPRIDTAADMLALLNLDDALWQCTSLPVDSIRTNPMFLQFLDGDGNRQIRTDEAKAAIRWIAENFTDLSGFERRSDTLEIAAVSAETPDGVKMREAAAAMLKALGKPAAGALTLSELDNDRQIRSCAACNGDGVVVADFAEYPRESALIEAAVAFTGGTDDLSGAKGINAAQLREYAARAEAALEYLKRERDCGEALRVFGDRTGELLAWQQELDSAVKAYFRSAETLAFLRDDPERLSRKTVTADLRSPQEVSELLDSLSLAAPELGDSLPPERPVNPRYADTWRKLTAHPDFQAFLTPGVGLTRAGWEAFSGRLAPYAEHLAARPSGFEDATIEELETLLSQRDSLEQMISSDQKLGVALSGISLLHKGALFQKYMLDFLNNFANLSELLTPDTVSMLQYGKLIMDARHFTLAMPVKNPAEHKKIVATSHICVAYVEISRELAGNPDRHLLAVAITHGSMKRLFTGKKGVFFGADGTEYSANVVDFIEQPVSLADALKSPFAAMGSFIGKQFEKILAVQSGDAQKNLDKQLSKPPTAPSGGSGNAGPMLLLGGGIGLAAIGSSIAFIAKSLQNVSLLTVLYVILAIMLIFGGPVMLNAIIKLCRRDLGRFIEAAGCALNHQLRLSFTLGRVFTFTPRLSGHTKCRAIIDRTRRIPGWVVWTSVLAAVLVGGLVGWYWSGSESPLTLLRALADRLRG